MLFTVCWHKFNDIGAKFHLSMMIVTKIQIKMSFYGLKEKDTVKEIKWELKAAISPGRSYNLAESDTCVVHSARLSSACNLCRPSRWQWNEEGRRASQRLQVIIPDSLKSVVAMEIIATDVVCWVGGADPSEGHRAQLGLNWINESIVNSGLTLIYQSMFKVLGIHYLPHLSAACCTKSQKYTHWEFDDLFTVRVRRVLQPKQHAESNYHEIYRKSKSNSNWGHTTPSLTSRGGDFTACWLSGRWMEPLCRFLSI